MSAAVLGSCKTILMCFLKRNENKGSYYQSLCITLIYRLNGKYNTPVLFGEKNLHGFVVTLSGPILFHLTLNDSRVGTGPILFIVFQGQNMMKEGKFCFAQNLIQFYRRRLRKLKELATEILSVF